MKTKLPGLFITTTLLLSSSYHAQTGNPSPYCASAFANNYNMVKDVSVAGTTFSIGQAGSWTSMNSYTFYTNASFPSLTVSAMSSIDVGFYSAPDTEPRYFALWIDYNSNGTFDTAELIMCNANTTNQELPTFSQPSVTISKTFTIPATTMPGIKRMRLVRGTNTQNPYGPYTAAFIPNACNAASGNDYGCTYDFNVNIVAGVTVVMPVAQFSANITTTVVNSSIQFTDLSTNAPTSWLWTITPNTGYTFTNSTTNTSQHPKVKFTGTGTYTVSLVATNSAGSNTVTKTAYIKINNTVGLNETSTEASALKLYPNPVRDYLHVDTGLPGIVSQVSLFDLSGRLLRRSENNYFNLEALPSGIYLIKMEGPDGGVNAARFIKE
jgi:hypothetical protein